MSKSNPAPRRERVERNIYRRPTGVFEVGFKDGAGVQRWRTVEGESPPLGSCVTSC